jgi:SAM-dependent methyltransferase
LINDAAATGFERGAADYERARPSYPQAVLDVVLAAGADVHGRGATVVDVAAGTGKLTRQLAATDVTVIGVEPVAAMRSVLGGFAPAVAGTAECLPLRGACAHAVTVAQAFHWFDVPRALAEIHRVLRPDGTLLMVWNERDVRVPWVMAMSEVVHAHDPGTAYEQEIDWPAAVAAAGGFTPLVRTDVDNPQRDVDAETVVARALSTSYVAAAGDAVRTQVARDVRAIVAGLGERFDLPYVTTIFTCYRR